MKRVWGMVAGGCLVSGLAVHLSACVHDNSTLYIQNVLAAQYQMSAGGQGCGYAADPTLPFIPSGILDVSLKLQYDAVFMVGNQMVPQSNPNQLRTETANVTIQGAVVRITDSAGNQLSTFTRLTSATLNAATGNMPGWAPVATTIIDQSTLENDAAIKNLGTAGGYVRLVTYTRFFGHALGGQSIESDEFEFPVDVCSGCLIGFLNSPSTLGADGGVAAGLLSPNCLPPVTTSGTSSMAPPVPCTPGQDLPVSCTECTGNAACLGAYPNGSP
jgi:hypothetical protein